jgi:hypothetical protein
MDLRGEIFVRVQNPSGELRELTTGGRPAEHSNIGRWQPPWDWAVVPGSTMKVFIAAVARELGVEAPPVFFRGEYRGVGRILRCHRAHGEVSDLRQGVAASCNSLFFRLSQSSQITEEALTRLAQDSGLTRPEMMHATCASSNLAWAGDIPSSERRALSFIGQEGSCSPLAVLTMYASLLGEGRPTWRLIGSSTAREPIIPSHMKSGLHEHGMPRGVTCERRAAAARYPAPCGQY